MKTKANQKIKCDVESCKFNNCDCQECTLKEIKVSCDCANDEVSSKSETICGSFVEESDK